MTEPEIIETAPEAPAPTLSKPEAIVRNSAESILLILEFVGARIDKPMTLQSENFEVVVRKRPGLFRKRPTMDKPQDIQPS